MVYREFAVAAGLSGVVEAGWAVAVPDTAAEQVRPILPDGCMDIVWTGSALHVAGPDTAPHPHRRSPGALACGLRFAPGRLPALLGVPAVALRDTLVPLADLHPGVARAARGRLADAEGRRDARAVLAGLVAVAVSMGGALGGSTDGAVPPDPTTAALARRLARPDGPDPSVAALADALGCTPRTLHRRSLAAFGYGPAVLRRILRFRRATALLATGRSPAEVAALAGYADQPHLSRELRALGGTSPRRYADAGRASA